MLTNSSKKGQDQRRNSWNKAGRSKGGWNNMTALQKEEWLGRKREEAEYLTQTVASAVTELIRLKRTECELGWKEAFVPPQNIIYGRRYNGINAFSLSMQARQRGQKDCRFLTKKSLRRLKDSEGRTAELLPGARPYLVMSPRRMPDKKLDAGCDLTNYSADRLEQREDGMWLKGKLFFSTIPVYSVADTTAVVPPLGLATGIDFEENSFFESVFEAMGVRIVTETGDGAYYSQPEDCIHLPPRECFISSDMYYATILHEFYHWTGHPDRENRPQNLAFGSDAYAREELRAELFSAIMSAMFELKGTLPKAAGYIEQWNNTLEGSPREIFAMAGEVQKLASAFYDVADGKDPEVSWMQGLDFSRVPCPVRDAGEEHRLCEDNWRREMGLVFTEEENAAGTAARRRPGGAGEEQDAADEEGCSLRPC